MGNQGPRYSNEKFHPKLLGIQCEPSRSRIYKPIHSILYSAVQPLERGFINYYSIIQG